MIPRFLALALVVAACAPAPADIPATGAPQPGDLIAGADGAALEEREPDLCQAADYQQYLGQPATIVPTLGITREYRVIEAGEIYSQVYNPSRINFWLAPTGEIARIGCG